MPLKTIRLSCELVATIDTNSIRFLSEEDVEPESEQQAISRRAAELAATIDPSTIHVNVDSRPFRCADLCAEAAEEDRKAALTKAAAKRKARR